MDELQQLMNLLGIPILDGQMARMVAEIASNDSGEISLEDFLSVMKAEGQNKHLRHLLRTDFERFRPMDCPRGYIPKGTLVDVLVKHFVHEEDDSKSDSKGGNTSGDEDEPDTLSHSMGSEASSASEGISMGDGSKPVFTPEVSNSNTAQWTVTGIEDTLKQIPAECYHKVRHDWINFEMLLSTMLGNDDPFTTSEGTNPTCR